MKSETEHLENRIVRIDHGNHPEADSMPNTVLVIGVERDIGVTLVNPCDKEDEILCINGPCSPNTDYQTFDEYRYNELFDNLVAQIETGRVIPEELGFGAGSPQCAFK